MESEKNKPFTSAHIKRIIEPILGPALRQFAANSTLRNFEDNPKGSSLFAATNYAMIYLFKKMLEQNNHPSAYLLFQSNNFDDEDYTEAEIFTVKNVGVDENDEVEKGLDEVEKGLDEVEKGLDEVEKGLDEVEKGLDEVEKDLEAEKRPSKKKQPHMCDEMERFMVENYGTIIEVFNAWLSGNPRPENFDEFGTYIRLAKQHLEEVIGEMTVAFFTQNGSRNLHAYIDHLNTNYRWGTEETLFLMHCSLQHEVRVPIDEVGRVEIRYDTPITLKVYHDGQPPENDENVDETPDMILNNSANVHWLSLIDSNFHSIKSERILRNDLLDIVGFNAYLQQLFEEAQDLEQKDKPLSDELYTLHKKLKIEKENYLAKDSQITRETFAESCKAILSDANTTVELQKQSGAKDVISSLLNCLYLLCTLDFSNLLAGNWNVVNPLSIDTTYHQVGLMKTVLNNLRDSEVPDDHQMKLQ
ncbi:hypothetical protein FOLKNPGA_01922 [Legionella sp. PC1000]|uniref:hypothetical protein n=1 Tax=Legionella sp. PC1000 TaxID=2746060 RepID=UPI0015F8A815|nr:hypothetical protein [Legionella sp. PC1000]QLZ69140.1 hypothetical protein FOLKNPGA_01922 [Legionella sp. PC1000]